MGIVGYGTDVYSVTAGSVSSSGKVTSWEVSAFNSLTGNSFTRKARHVVIAVGGKPSIPTIFQGLKRVAHSSTFASTIKKIEEDEKEQVREGKKLKFAVIGSGQSGAEIYNDLSERFGESAEVRLCIKGTSLRPSDDSPLCVFLSFPSPKITSADCKIA